MKFSTKVKIFLLLLVLVGAGTAYLDYYRMTQGEQPAVCIKKYNSRTKIETYRGLFYIAERKVKNNVDERLELSSNITYRFLNQTVKIKLNRPKDQYDFYLLITPAIECPSPSFLVHEYDDKKVYLDCIINIQVKEKEKKESLTLHEDLEKKPSRIEDILKNLSYVGFAEDGKTEKFVTLDDTFSNKTLYVYKCHNKDVEDIYITRNPKMEEDYCERKNDTLKPPEEEKKDEETPSEEKKEESKEQEE